MYESARWTSEELREMARAYVNEARRLEAFLPAPWAVDNRRASLSHAASYRREAVRLAEMGR